jgi:hypothetical protein
MRILLKNGNYSDGNIFPMKIACLWHATVCNLPHVCQAARRSTPEVSDLRHRPTENLRSHIFPDLFFFIVVIPTDRDVMMAGQPPNDSVFLH